MRLPRLCLSLLLLCFAASSARAQPGSVFIEELTWPEVQSAIAHGKTTAIFYAGSTEQNGPHMALGKHNWVARHVAQRIAEELGDALVYPVLPYAPTGDPARKTGHMRFPGSVSLSASTYGAVARDVASSAIAAGFRNVVLMGDHGDGQEVLKRVALELDRQWAPKGTHVHYVPDLYYKSQEQVNAYLAQKGLPAGRHAGIADTSELMAVDTAHQRIRADKLAPGDGRNGVDGDPRRASAELGRVFLDMKVKAAVAQIRSLAR